MQIDRIAAVIRPRSDWEAVDLGFVMAAHWRRSLWSAWALSVLPVCLLILLLAPTTGWAFLLLWWLKPLYDRVALFVLGRALFGAPPSAIEVLRALPRLWSRHLLSALLLYRFSPRRSFMLPVWELEGQRGWKAQERTKVLKQRAGALAGQLTLVCILFEYALIVALAVLGYLFLPPTHAPDIDLIFADLANGEFPRGIGLLFVLFDVVAITVIEPFYVAAGFALYLNRRTFLEGWDVELAFRRLGRRLAGAAARTAGVLLCVMSFALFVTGTASAQEAEPRDPKDVIEEVLAHEDFERVTARVSAPSERDASVDLGGLASVLRAVGWIAVAVLAGVVLYLVARASGGFSMRRRRRAERAPPSTAFGLDIRPESLPANVAGEALRLWRAGQAREALSLLYRGSIARLVERDGLVIEVSDTERDCLRRVASLTDGSKADYFRSLTLVWQVCAYGRALPEGERVEGLCSRWPEYFEVAA